MNMNYELRKGSLDQRRSAQSASNKRRRRKCLDCSCCDNAASTTKGHDAVRNCQFEDASEPQCCRQEHTSDTGGNPTDLHAAGLLPPSPRPSVSPGLHAVLARAGSADGHGARVCERVLSRRRRGSGGGGDDGGSIVILLLVALLACLPTLVSAAAAAAAQPSIDTAHLANLCRLDSLCAARFFLSSSSSTSGLSEYDHRLFAHLFSLFLTQHASSGGPPPPSANRTADDAWWVFVLRHARFCDGRANYAFILGRGCRCVGRPEACDEHDGSAFRWEYISFIIVAVLVAIAVIYGTWSLREHFRHIQAMVASITPAPSTVSTPPPLPQSSLVYLLPMPLTSPVVQSQQQQQQQQPPAPPPPPQQQTTRL